VAIAAYRRAAALEPHPEIYLHLGDALLAAGELEEARRNYRIALLLDPWLRSSVPAGVL
jgi:Flp pilus assembly protein TadD